MGGRMGEGRERKSGSKRGRNSRRERQTEEEWVKGERKGVRKSCTMTHSQQVTMGRRSPAVCIKHKPPTPALDVYQHTHHSNTATYTNPIMQKTLVGPLAVASVASSHYAQSEYGSITLRG